MHVTIVSQCMTGAIHGIPNSHLLITVLATFITNTLSVFALNAWHVIKKIHAHTLVQKHKHTDQIYKSPHFTELTYVE